jgi:hypothetical protein
MLPPRCIRFACMNIDVNMSGSDGAAGMLP